MFSNLREHCSLKHPFVDHQDGKNFLSQISPGDEHWDKFRSQADKFKDLYRGTVYDRYADRINDCSGLLGFITVVNPETGESKLKLDSARFCRVPRCPVCQWRRQLMWRAKTFKVMPQIFEDYPSARFVFLTLTVRNCSLDDLRSTLAHMNKSWERFSKRKQFPAIGWIKAVEVTRVWDCYDRDKFVGRHGSTWVEKWQAQKRRKLRLVSTDECHPHFHCLLMVNPGYFGKNYLSQEKWTEMWQQSLRVDYAPILHVQAVKSLTDSNEGMLEAVLETIKYSVKPSDVLSDNSVEGQVSDQEWLVGLTQQLYKTKSIATGGILKKYLRQLEEEPEDLIHVDDVDDLEQEPVNKSVSLMFAWFSHIKKYLLIHSNYKIADDGLPDAYLEPP